MARGGGINIGMLVGAGVGILALAIVFMLGPVIGGQLESSMPTLPADSEWNATYNTDLKTGSDVWEMLTPFLLIVGLVILAAIIIMVVRGVA
ncbi:MAG TPA: hypothetical protein PK445_10085 [Methanolinea sp.]|nr:hypothetical protein [Methanolinea sp.]